MVLVVASRPEVGLRSGSPVPAREVGVSLWDLLFNLRFYKPWIHKAKWISTHWMPNVSSGVLSKQRCGKARCETNFDQWRGDKVFGLPILGYYKGSPCQVNAGCPFGNRSWWCSHHREPGHNTTSLSSTFQNGSGTVERTRYQSFSWNKIAVQLVFWFLWVFGCFFSAPARSTPYFLNPPWLTPPILGVYRQALWMKLWGHMCLKRTLLWSTSWKIQCLDLGPIQKACHKSLVATTVKYIDGSGANR